MADLAEHGLDSKIPVVIPEIPVYHIRHVNVSIRNFYRKIYN